MPIAGIAAPTAQGQISIPAELRRPGMGRRLRKDGCTPLNPVYVRGHPAMSVSCRMWWRRSGTDPPPPRQFSAQAVSSSIMGWGVQVSVDPPKRGRTPTCGYLLSAEALLDSGVAIRLILPCSQPNLSRKLSFLGKPKEDSPLRRAASPEARHPLIEYVRWLEPLVRPGIMM